MPRVSRKPSVVLGYGNDIVSQFLMSSVTRLTSKFVGVVDDTAHLFVPVTECELDMRACCACRGISNRFTRFKIVDAKASMQEPAYGAEG